MYTTKVGDGIYLIDTVALGHSNTVGAYVVKGAKTAVVDTGYASTYENVLRGLAEVGVSPSEVDFVIPTHVHLDHAGASGHLMGRMPNAKLIAHERAVPHLADPGRLIESATRVFGKEIIGLYGIPTPVPRERMTAVGEEMSLDLGNGMSATLLHSPGHAPHQISVMLERQKVLLTGDAVGVMYPGTKLLIPTTPPPSLEPSVLLDTVDRLSQLAPRTLLVPHFGAKDDPEFAFESTRRKMEEWIGKIRSMRNAGMGFDEIAESMVADVAAEAGIVELPVYAQLLVRTSTMGIHHYLEKNA